MFEEAQQLDFSQNPSRVRNMVKDVNDLLDSNFLIGRSVGRRAHYAITTLANNLINVVTFGLITLREEICWIRIHCGTNLQGISRLLASATAAGQRSRN